MFFSLHNFTVGSQTPQVNVQLLLTATGAVVTSTGLFDPYATGSIQIYPVPAVTLSALSSYSLKFSVAVSAHTAHARACHRPCRPSSLR